MRKKIIGLLVIFVVLFDIFGVNFTYVEAISNATTQPGVCNGPSEMMQNYFNFQQEVKSILLGSQIDERRFYASAGEGWLFTKGSLKLPSALDFVASNIVGGVKSNISTAGTSIVLLLLTSASVIQSNIEGLAILFKDRPIVRDYKTMLDIETELFDVAYFRSKQINLTLRLEGKEIYDNINRVIEKYQGKGLLDKGTKLKGTETMANILEEMIRINTVMKDFMLFPGSPGEKALNDYNGCFGNLSIENCKVAPILKFHPKAIEQLKKDYSGLRTFGACNEYVSNFKNTISKSLDNNLDSVKIAFKDVKDALKRLDSALIGDLANGKDGAKASSRCDISDYEMAQLRAYWGPDWECGKVIDVSMQVPSEQILEIYNYIKNKKSQNDQRNKNKGVIKEAAQNLLQNVDSDSYEVLKGEETNLNKLRLLDTTVPKEDLWFKIYGDSKEFPPKYNPEFKEKLAVNFVSNYEQIMGDYYQSQWNASSSDLAYEMKKIRGIIDQVNTTIAAAKSLNSELANVVNYQCP